MTRQDFSATRRHIMLAAAAAAAFPVQAAPLQSPKERWRLACLEVEAAFRELHPGLVRVACDYAADDPERHAIFFISGHPRRV